jgi:hypothetical protein
MFFNIQKKRKQKEAQCGHNSIPVDIVPSIKNQYVSVEGRFPVVPLPFSHHFWIIFIYCKTDYSCKSNYHAITAITATDAQEGSTLVFTNY